MQEKIKEALSFRYAAKVFDPSKPVAKEDVDMIVRYELGLGFKE